MSQAQCFTSGNDRFELLGDNERRIEATAQASRYIETPREVAALSRRRGVAFPGPPARQFFETVSLGGRGIRLR